MRFCGRVITLLALVSVLPLDGGELTVLLTPESGITVGDPVRVVLEARVEQGRSVTPPDWSKQWPPEDQNDVELVSVGDPITERQGSSTVWRQILTLQAFRPGPIELPAPVVELVSTGAPPIQLEAATPLRWTVESMLPGDAEVQMRPPSPMHPLPLGAPFWTLASVMAVAAIAGTWIASRAGAFAPEQQRWRQEPLTELQLALKALDPRNPVRGHVGLSTSLRRFLERRAGTPALERTTTEIYRDLAEMPVDDASRQHVRQILLNCDQVKFGGFPASREELTDRVRRTRRVAEQIEAHLLAAETAETAEAEVRA